MIRSTSLPSPLILSSNLLVDLSPFLFQDLVGSGGPRLLLENFHETEMLFVCFLLPLQ